MEPVEFLEIRNGKMVGATSGREIRLGGTNIGGWMNLEDFINGYAGTDQSIRHAMKETIGEAKATFFFDRMLDYFFTEDDVRFLKEHGLNVVRLSLNYRRRHGPRDAAPGIGVHAANAIVLVERVQQQIRRGLTIREALVEAGGTRLRPILMTAAATIGALVPLAAGVGGGSVISSGLAVVVIGGLASSTLLTLVVVPVMYELLHFRKSRMERRLANRPQAEAIA